MIVGIDSANNLTCTGIISGNELEITDFYEELRTIFAKRKVYPPFKWGNLTENTRNSCKNEIEELFNNHDSKLKFNVLFHKKPLSISKKEVLFDILPTSISENLAEWIKNISGFVIFEIDNDYNIKNKNTHDFIESLFKRIIPTLTDKIITIRREHGVHKVTIKKKVGPKDRSTIHLAGRVSNVKDSRSIQIIDVILGYVLNRKCKFRKDKLYIRTIC